MRAVGIRLKSVTAKARVQLTPAWVTDGHWAVRRERVANGRDAVAFARELNSSAELLLGCELAGKTDELTSTLTDAIVAELANPPIGTVALLRAPWVYTCPGKEDYCVFASASGRSWAFVQRSYADAFDLWTLYAAGEIGGMAMSALFATPNACDSAEDAPNWLVVMPANYKDVIPAGCSAWQGDERSLAVAA
jgi:hypothetical protein